MRNTPPVTGNILWAKQLLNRIEEPMRKFRVHTTLMQNSKEAKKIIKMYNKVLYQIEYADITLQFHSLQICIEFDSRLHRSRGRW